MIINNQQRTRLKMQSHLVKILVLSIIFLCASLSTRFVFEADWSSSGRNTLSNTSHQVLNNIDQAISMTAYASANEPLRGAINEIISRYQRHKKDITLDFVNPETQPDVGRELELRADGELFIKINNRTERVTVLTETNITNALQRLAQAQEHWLVFLEGHGERKPRGIANHDLQSWVNQLEQRGYQVQSINLASTPAIPQNTRVLLIPSPQVPLLPGEIDLIHKYINAGGNALILIDPEKDEQPLQSITESLGIEILPGVIVDPTTQLFGIQDPRFTLVTEYGPHPITGNFELMTVFPQAVGLEIAPSSEWQAAHILSSTERAWSETGELKDQVNFDNGQDLPGPLTIGLALVRDLTAMEAEISREQDDLTQQQQRIVVVGDGDFLANSHLGNAGNLDLGLHMVNWLSAEDNLINIPANVRSDTILELSRTWQIVIGFGFLAVIPFLLAGTGFAIWWRRRKR